MPAVCRGFKKVKMKAPSGAFLLGVYSWILTYYGNIMKKIIVFFNSDQQW